MNVKLNQILHADCMDIMQDIPDKYFELAIVDPPYGIGEGNKKNSTRSCYTGFGGKKTFVYANNYGGQEFDSKIPNENYFNELFRVSQNQIIWGGNYFVKYLTGSMGWVFWDKDNGGCDQSDGELAYTSFKKGLRKFKFKWQGLLQQDMKNKETRIHPTQKPVALYKWLLHNYAKQGDKILDTHSGSGSLAIACIDMNFDYLAIEKDKDYYEASLKRIDKELIKYKLAL